MKIKATKVAELEYIDVEVTALNTKISLGWHTKGQAAELRDMLLSVVDDLSGFIEERPFGYVKPEQILITADEAETLKELMEHAQKIPDLEAELREVLAGMGYDLVARSPFVEPEAAVETAQIKIDWPPCNPGCDEDFNGYRTKLCRCAPAKESVQKQTKPTEDMTDWRNWREGDVLTCVRPFNGYLSEGENYVVSEDVTGDYVGIILQGDSTISSFRPDRFRFHSRPAKGEK